MDIGELQQVVFFGADLLVKFVPAAGTAVTIVEDLANMLETAGFIKVVPTAEEVEQIRAQAAGASARAASAVEESRHPRTPQTPPQPPVATGETLESTVK